MWTDERLDDAFRRMDDGFRRMDEGFRETRADIASLRRELHTGMLAMLGAVMAALVALTVNAL